ncbi:MAG: class D sortase, partial [Anaerolineales bacterium]
MAKDRRLAEELTIAELEALLARKKMDARQARLKQFQRSGRVLPVSSPQTTPDTESINQVNSVIFEDRKTNSQSKQPLKRFLNRALVIVEVAAAVGFLYILLSGAGALKRLNAEVAEALSLGQPVPTPLITAVVLPSGHTPPTSPGGAQPNEAEIPENLRPLVQSLPFVAVPTPGPEQARSMFITKIWNDAAPVVQGDGWDQLRKGVGQYIGSGNPGENGNLVLSAHNDIFGELFRDLDQLEPGDEIVISTSTQEYTYRVTDTRIVAPTEVSVLEPTSKPTI